MIDNQTVWYTDGFPEHWGILVWNDTVDVVGCRTNIWWSVHCGRSRPRGAQYTQNMHHEIYIRSFCFEMITYHAIIFYFFQHELF